MRTTIITMAMLAAGCPLWNPHGLGSPADPDTDASSGTTSSGASSGDFMPNSKRPVAEEHDTTSGSTSSSGADIETDADESSSESTTTSFDESSSGASSSGSSTTSDEPPQPCSYEDCSDVSDCGDDPADRCAGFSCGIVCSRTCAVGADCDPRPEWAPTYPACLDGYCHLPCLDDLDCGAGQVCHPGLPGRCIWPH